MLAQHAGLRLEDKGMSLALHYRQAPELGAYVQQLMHQLVAQTRRELVVQEGKCFVEVKPPGKNKGTAVAEYLVELPFLGRRPVFIGDDQTDAYGFVAVNVRGGLSIGVGPGDFSAHYRLPDAVAVREWLSGALRHDPDHNSAPP